MRKAFFRLRQAIWLGGIVAGLALGGPAGAGSPPSMPPLQARLDALVASARPGQMGLWIADLSTGRQWQAGPQVPYPMMSVFKAPVAAAILDRVDQGQLDLGQSVWIDRSELSGGRSRIAEAFQGQRMAFTVNQLLQAMVSDSDNTAADALIKLAGGPSAVTRFLRQHHIEGMRIDLDERGVSQLMQNLPAGGEPPSQESEAEYRHRLHQGYLAYLADPRNRSTPQAAVQFLQQLWQGRLLSRASTDRLLALMDAQRTPRRLRAGFPQDVRLADKCGTSFTLEGRTAAFNDIGIARWPDGHVVLIAAFLSDSPAAASARDRLFATLASEVAETVQPATEHR